MKNNIDWVKIRENGELKYRNDIKWGRNVIDYEEAVQALTLLLLLILGKRGEIDGGTQ